MAQYTSIKDDAYGGQKRGRIRYNTRSYVSQNLSNLVPDSFFDFPRITLLMLHRLYNFAATDTRVTRVLKVKEDPVGLRYPL